MAQLSSYDSGNPETPETDDSVDVSKERLSVKYSTVQSWFDIIIHSPLGTLRLKMFN